MDYYSFVFCRVVSLDPSIFFFLVHDCTIYRSLEIISALSKYFEPDILHCLSIFSKHGSREGGTLRSPDFAWKREKFFFDLLLLNLTLLDLSLHSFLHLLYSTPDLNPHSSITNISRWSYQTRTISSLRRWFVLRFISSSRPFFSS